MNELEKKQTSLQEIEAEIEAFDKKVKERRKKLAERKRKAMEKERLERDKSYIAFAKQVIDFYKFDIGDDLNKLDDLTWHLKTGQHVQRAFDTKSHKKAVKLFDDLLEKSKAQQEENSHELF